jgi:hypothetical protein
VVTAMTVEQRRQYLQQLHQILPEVKDADETRAAIDDVLSNSIVDPERV